MRFYVPVRRRRQLVVEERVWCDWWECEHHSTRDGIKDRARVITTDLVSMEMLDFCSPACREEALAFQERVYD
jgi:hypothetical protein